MLGPKRGLGVPQEPRRGICRTCRARSQPEGNPDAGGFRLGGTVYGPCNTHNLSRDTSLRHQKADIVGLEPKRREPGRNNRQFFPSSENGRVGSGIKPKGKGFRMSTPSRSCPVEKPASTGRGGKGNHYTRPAGGVGKNPESGLVNHNARLARAALKNGENPSHALASSTHEKGEELFPKGGRAFGGRGRRGGPANSPMGCPALVCE